MATLLYQGHGSYRIVSSDKTVIYVDPFAGKGYELPADLILVTHQHSDHNQTGLPAKKEGIIIFSRQRALPLKQWKLTIKTTVKIPVLDI